MSLLDRFIGPTKDYIKCKDLLINLSGMNGKPLYEIVRYLLCCDLCTLGFYHIDSKFKIENINSEVRDYTSDFLVTIKEAIRLGNRKDEELVYYSDEDLESFSSGTKERIIDIIDCRNDYYFNKKELLGFEPLDGLLHFDTIENESPPNNNSLMIELEERISELLDELVDKKDIIETLSSKRNKDKTNGQLFEKIAAANAKIKQQEQTINRLSDQLKEQADKLADTSDQLSDRNEKSYQITIGLLLELMTLPKVEGDRPPFTSEAVIIGRIADKSIYGQGKTTLETRFSDVKTTLEQTRKKAFKS